MSLNNIYFSIRMRNSELIIFLPFNRRTNQPNVNYCNNFFVTLALLIIYVFLNGIYEIFEAFVDFYYGDTLHLHSLKKHLELHYKEAIVNHFPYYKKLKSHRKDLFERKVQRFIDGWGDLSRVMTLTDTPSRHDSSIKCHSHPGNFWISKSILKSF